jgi:hypothetical protein
MDRIDIARALGRKLELRRIRRTPISYSVVDGKGDVLVAGRALVKPNARYR